MNAAWAPYGRERIKRYGHRAMAHIVSHLLHTGAIYDHVNFDLWQERGYHVTPVHFYHPIPDTRELRSHFPHRFALSGINLRADYQVSLLRDVFPQYAAEYNAFPTKRVRDDQFFLDNDAFGGTDPHVFYSLIRHLKPKRVLEIGSGFSTLIGGAASAINGTTSYIAIDPWPRAFVELGVPHVEVVRRRVEEMDITYFEQLERNDILFIDSSHVVRTGGDVAFLILEVLPRLSKGVVVHFHDIFFPFDYPADMILDRHWFWTEQYLLHAYLCENSHVDVLFASEYIAHEFPALLKQTFPNAMWWGGGSFWFQKS